MKKPDSRISGAGLGDTETNQTPSCPVFTDCSAWRMPEVAR